MKQFRQGDVLIVEVPEIPSNAVKRRRPRGKLVLAYGEVTGHHHAIAEPDVELLEVREPVADDAAARRVFLSVMGGPALLTHEEHDTVTIPPGNYEVVIQREYQPGALPQRVVD